jgi:hypothetical protein
MQISCGTHTHTPILRISLYFNLNNMNQNSNRKSNFDVDSLHHMPLKLIDIKMCK